MPMSTIFGDETIDDSPKSCFPRTEHLPVRVTHASASGVCVV